MAKTCSFELCFAELAVLIAVQRLLDFNPADSAIAVCVQGLQALEVTELVLLPV